MGTGWSGARRVRGCGGDRGAGAAMADALVLETEAAGVLGRLDAATRAAFHALASAMRDDLEAGRASCASLAAKWRDLETGCGAQVEAEHALAAFSPQG